MKIVTVVSAAALVAVSMPVSSFASEAVPCSCLTAGPSAGQVGNVVSAKGNVLTNGAKDFVAVKQGTPVSIGSEISVGADSAAQISVGTCGLSLAPGSVTRISAQEGGNICVSSIQTATSSYGAHTIEHTAGTPSWVPVALFGGLVGTAGLLILTNDSDDDKSVSP